MRTRPAVDFTRGQAGSNVDAELWVRRTCIIAEAAAPLPHTAALDRRRTGHRTAQLCGFDDDLAKEAVAALNRIRAY